MIVTTSDSKSAYLREWAEFIAVEYGIRFVARERRSVARMHAEEDPCIFITDDRRGLRYCEAGKSEVFYHPNMSYHRVLNLQKGEPDGLVSVCGLREGMSFFDGTLGLASDALVASAAVGNGGICVGVEKSRVIYLLVREGLRFYAEREPLLREASERLRLICGDSLDVLSAAPENGYDVVYLDFMFREPVAASLGIQGLRDHSAKDTMTAEFAKVAFRAAKRRVIVKTDHTSLKPLRELGFRFLKEGAKRSFCYVGMEKDV